MWIIVELLSIFLALFIIITQVLIPISMDKPLFWLFRKKNRFLEDIPKRSFNDEVEHLKERKAKVKSEANDVSSEIAKKVDKVNELTQDGENDKKSTQQKTNK